MSAAIPIVRLIADDQHRGSFTIDASDMQWPPGRWPASFEIVDRYGETIRVDRARPMIDDGEIVAVWYVGSDSIRHPIQVTVWND